MTGTRSFMMNISRSSALSSSLGMTTNRCRADSGSTFNSTQSSSSDNTSSSNRSKTSNRRRSHRPRGCRGGSSRKKKQGGKVPEEIGTGDTVITTSSSSVSSTANENVNVRHGKEVSADENTGDSRAPMQQKQQQQPAKFNMPLTANSFYGENKHMPMTQKADSILPQKGGKAGNGNAHPVLPPLQKKPLVPNSIESTMMGPPPPQSFPVMDRMGRNSNRGGPGCLSQTQTQILPPLYRPEQAVMQEPTNGARHQTHNIYALQQNRQVSYNENSYHYNGSNSLLDGSVNHNQHNKNYHPNMDYHQAPAPSTQGPYNDYDIHSNHHHDGYGHHQNAQRDEKQQQQLYNGNTSNANNNYGFVAGNNTYEVDFPSFHTENIHEELPPSVIGTNNNDNHTYNSTNDFTLLPDRNDVTYRSERIEKQRQMMAEGGSLFVTSPRSFLLGWKSDDAPHLYD